MAGKTRKEQIEEMLALEPDDPELRYFLAMECASAGQHEEAASRLTDLIQFRPDYIPAFVQAGQILARLGRDSDARAVFQRGIVQAEAKGDTHAAGEMTEFLDSLS